MALRQKIQSGGVSRRLACPNAAPAVALHSVLRTRVSAHPQSSASSTFVPSVTAPSPRVASIFPAPTNYGGQRAGSASHVCAATRGEKPIEFDVNFAKEELSPCRRHVTVTVPARAVKDVFKRGVKRLERDVIGTLRGWQAGKPLPLEMVIKQVGGQKKFKSYCLEELLLEALPRGLEAASTGELVDPMSVEVPAAEFPAMLERYDPGKEFAFNVLYQVAPPVVWRTPPEDLSVTIKDTGDFSTDAAAVDDLIRQYRKQHGFSRVVASRGLAMGDTLVMDMEIRSKASGQALPGLSHTRISFDTDQDVLGITQGMLGMKQGETRTFSMKLPEDYEVEFWQNLEVTAAVKVHEIFEWTLPEFNDAYVAQHHGDSYRSAAEMREALIASTAMQRLQLIDKALEDEVVKAVAAAVDMPEVPPNMVEELGERQFQAQLLQMVQDRIGSQEDIAKMATEEMVKEFIEKRRKELEDMVRFNLASDDIFARKGLEVDEETVRQEFELRKRQMQVVGQQFEPEEMLADVRETVKSVTVIEWLKDNVKRVVLPYNSEDDSEKEGKKDGGAAKPREPVAV